MTVRKLEHIGVVVEDLNAATDFFVALGLELGGEASVEGEWADRIVGLEGIQADIAMMRTPDGADCLELVKFHSPPNGGEVQGDPPNAYGLRHLAFLVDDLDSLVEALEARGGELIGEIVRYKDIYRTCYVRGPAAIIVELAEPLG